jgi:hypothetical protein
MPRDNNEDANIDDRDEPEEIGKPHGINEEGEEKRGQVVRNGGNKVHGDKLEGMIPEGSPAERANGRPTRDDGDNDDEGDLGDSNR